MNARLTIVTATRILKQLRSDPRTLALIILVPCVLLGLLAWIYDSGPMFDRVGPALLGIFPFVIMFLITSITTLRERSSGTLERLLTTPLGKADFLFGYALAFALLAAVQALVATAFAVWVCGMNIQGSLATLVLVAIVDAVLGCTFGLFVSAFAHTEFQAIQFMPAFVLPQFLLCGMLVPRDQLNTFLHGLSDILPLSYAVDAMTTIATQTTAGDIWRDILIMIGFSVVAVALGAATLRRRTT